MSEYSAVLIEPYYGGSHKVLTDCLNSALVNKYGEGSVDLITMTPKKWHWRARTSALYLSEVIPVDRHYRVLFASSVVNLAELIGLRRDLGDTVKIVYFHENQLVYPVKETKERDFQYGYNQILTCLAADIILFNSKFNMDSFFGSLGRFLKLQPDFRCPSAETLSKKLLPKSSVLGFPVPKPIPPTHTKRHYSSPIHIVWPHRWEHDKDPKGFLETILRLHDEGMDFQVSVLGEEAERGYEAESVREARGQLVGRVGAWGRLPRNEYIALLSTAHIAVSTAKHEFYGVAMLEAAMLGCFVLCPNGLVYPEIYPEVCLYSGKEDLYTRLEGFCKDPSSLDEMTRVLLRELDFAPFEEGTLIPHYLRLFSEVGA